MNKSKNKSGLSTRQIACWNLKRKTSRTVYLIVLVAFLSLVLSGGIIVVRSIENGLDSVAKRLGADAMVVPTGYDEKAQGALLRGEPSTFYLDGNILDSITDIQGIDQASPQLFFASFSAECCAMPVQLIGFDPQTDFVIQPWLSNTTEQTIADGEIMIGSSINTRVGEYLKFFGKDYKVAATLDKTGMGFDTSVFMNMTTAREAILDYKEQGGTIDQIGENAVSSIIISVEKDYKPYDVAISIRKAYRNEEVDVVITKSMMTNMSNSLVALLRFISIFGLTLWFITVGVLAIVFTISLNERKREFGIYRVLGATRRKLSAIILWESVILSVSGGVIGIAIVALLLYPTQIYVTTSFQLPYLQPKINEILIFMSLSLIITTVTGPIASMKSAYRIGKMNTYEMIREDE